MLRRALFCGLWAALAAGVAPASGQQLQAFTHYADPARRIVREVYTARVGTDTVRHGLFRRFYPSGKLEAVGRFTDGRPDSVYTEFYESGQRRLEVPWVGGQKAGAFKTWGPAGRLLQEGTYLANEQTGPFQTYYPSGKVKMKAAFVAGFPEGLVQEFDSAGTLQREITYARHQPNGPTRTFWPNGARKTECNYQNGTPAGTETAWYENGQVAAETVVKPGAKEGAQRWYFPSGKLQREARYRIGLLQATASTYRAADEPAKTRKREMRPSTATSGYLDGPEISYFEDGTVAGRATWRMGAPTGTAQVFWPGGTPREETRYRRDGRDFDRLTWYASGNPQAEEHWVDNLKTGDWSTWYDGPARPPRERSRYLANRLSGEQLTYHPTGQVATKGLCEGNRRTGLWVSYDPEGHLLEEITWKSGAKNGPHRTLRPDGTVAVRGAYIANRPNGQWVWLDAQGKPERTAWFRKGVEVEAPSSKKPAARKPGK